MAEYETPYIGPTMEEVLQGMLDDCFGKGNAELLVPYSPNIRIPDSALRPRKIEEMLNDVAWWTGCHLESVYTNGKARFILKAGRVGPPPTE